MSDLSQLNAAHARQGHAHRLRHARVRAYAKAPGRNYIHPPPPPPPISGQKAFFRGGGLAAQCEIPPHIAQYPFEIVSQGGGIARFCLVFIGYRASIAEIPPPQKGYLSDTCAIPYENKANGCDTPSAILSRKGIARYGGVSRTGPLRKAYTALLQ